MLLVFQKNNDLQRASKQTCSINIQMNNTTEKGPLPSAHFFLRQHLKPAKKSSSTTHILFLHLLGLLEHMSGTAVDSVTFINMVKI